MSFLRDFIEEFLMKNKNYYEENGYKWGYEKTNETPYYYDMKFKGRIWCDYKLFRMLRSIDEKEYKHQDEESRCVVLNKNGLPVKCRLKCSTECPYGLNYSRTGSPISIEAIQEGNSHIDFIDNSADPKQLFDVMELENKLKEVLNELSPKDCDLYISIKISGEKEGDIAKKLGVSRNAIHKKIVRISKFIEEKLKSFID